MSYSGSEAFRPFLHFGLPGRTRAYLRIKHASLLDAVSTDLQVMPLTGLQQVAGFLSF